MTHKPIGQNMESNHQQSGSFMVGVPRTRIMTKGLFKNYFSQISFT